eukprot:jgi/Tetstr1/444314/TSEL_032205.t1
MWSDAANLGGSSSARTARRGKGYVFNYSYGKRNCTLKDHIARYHRELNVIYTDKVLNELPVSSAQPSKRTSQAASSLAAAGGTIADCFRSSKKVKKDTLKARVVLQLLGMLMVYARLPFRLVDNPLFQSVCWFLDPSMPVPSRHELTRQIIGNLKTDVEEALKNDIKGVDGMTITYDLWVSRKTGDLLAICIHHITADWTWRMLARMLLMKDVVHQFYSEDAPISKRGRCPTPIDWHVAKAVVDELDYPCKVVVKAHDKGHWLLSDALN